MTGLEQQGCFRTKRASLTDLSVELGRESKALTKKNLDMFENSELSQNIVNENNGLTSMRVPRMWIECLKSALW